MKGTAFEKEKEQNRTAVPTELEDESQQAEEECESQSCTEVFFLLPPFCSPPETKLDRLRSASTLPLRRPQRIALNLEYGHEKGIPIFHFIPTYQHGGQFPRPRPLKLSSEPPAPTTESTSSSPGPTLSTSILAIKLLSNDVYTFRLSRCLIVTFYPSQIQSPQPAPTISYPRTRSQAALL